MVQCVRRSGTPTDGPPGMAPAAGFVRLEVAMTDRPDLYRLAATPVFPMPERLGVLDHWHARECDRVAATETGQGANANDPHPHPRHDAVHHREARGFAPAPFRDPGSRGVHGCA